MQAKQKHVRIFLHKKCDITHFTQRFFGERTFRLNFHVISK